MDLTALSVFALWTAAALYAVAMVAYSIRMARVADLKVERKRAVTVGGPAAASSDGVAQDESAERAPGGTENDRRVAAKALGIGRAATLVGVVMHAIGVVARGFDAGHVPWSNMYEVTITGALAGVVAFLIVQARRDVTYLAAGVTGLATISLGLALTVLYKEATGLQPALQSFWILIHVSVAVIAMGVLGVAAVASLMQLLQHEREDDNPRFLTRNFRFLDAAPDTVKLEALAFRLNAIGFVAWTFTLIAGAIWAEHVWGRYWGWDPKEVWTLVIWLLYAAYLHARTTQGWSGRRAAWLSLAGFTSVILNFTAVNVLFDGKHTYGEDA